MQLVAGPWLDGEGLSYIGPTSAGFGSTTHSNITFGNDGLVFNAAINSVTQVSEQPIAVLDALHDFSDHLPVVADYQIPGIMDILVDSSPPQVLRNATVEVDFNVHNTAPVAVAIAADELDFIYTTTGHVTGTGAGSAQATGPGVARTVAFDTATPAFATGSLDVQATSEGAADADFSMSLALTVLDHADASFNAGSSVDVITVDLGLVARGGPASTTLPLHNLVSPFGAALSSALDLDGIDADDPDGKFELGAAFTGLAAGASADLNLDGITDDPGQYGATFTLTLSDEDLPGELSQQVTLHALLEVSSALLGDLNGDTLLSNADINAFVLALTDRPGYALVYPGVDPDVVGDFTGDHLLTNGDINGFVDALTGGSLAGSAAAWLGLPEPTTGFFMLVGGLIVTRRMRR